MYDTNMFESTDSEWVQVENLDDQATMLKSYKNGDFLLKRKVKKSVKMMWRMGKMRRQ